LLEARTRAVDEDHRFYNLLGGELWSGASHKHFGGSYQGDGGPAIQLGAFATSPDSASATTAYMTITPPGDLEGNGFNGVSVMCDNHSEVMFVDPATLEIMTGSKSCHRAGSNTQGLGTSPSLPGFILKMSSGDGRPNWVLPVGVNSVLLQEGKEAGITCFNPSNAGAGTPSCLMRLDGTDSSGARVPYAGISSQIGDNTTSSQKGSLHLQYVTGGKLTDGMTVDDDGGVTIPAYKGAKAPVCIDATGRLYRGNDTGKGIPCP